MSLTFDRDFDVTYGQLVEVAPGIRRIVADNPGPFTFKGTGTYVIGRGEVAVIDPGPTSEKHIDALVTALAGETISHLLITHTHPDHSPAARAVKELTGARTSGFGPHPAHVDDPEDHYDDPWFDEKPDTTDDTDAGRGTDGEEGKADTDFVPDVAVAHGDVIEGTDWKVEAVHTPGHISNHLCFRLLGTGVLFSGDHVMGWSTSVISPPAGDLADYLRSLQLLLDDPRDTTYWPTHGPAIRDPRPYVEGLLAHRNERTRGILARLAAGDTTIKELIVALYPGLDPRLRKAAGRSVLAHLVELARRGDVVAVPAPTARAAYRLA